MTSIGPGALQALAASLVPASDGIGVWYLFGDETTEDEGFNMQQIQKHDQGLFLQLGRIDGSCLHIAYTSRFADRFTAWSGDSGPSQPSWTILFTDANEHSTSLDDRFQPGGVTRDAKYYAGCSRRRLFAGGKLDQGGQTVLSSR